MAVDRENSKKGETKKRRKRVGNTREEQNERVAENENNKK